MAGTNFFVSKTGNNGNGLSLANAKTTILAGMGLMGAGDILNINDGTYDEQLFTAPSGNSSNTTIIRAINPLAVTILPVTNINPAGWGVWNLNSSSFNYITLDGLILDGRNCSEGAGFYGVGCSH